MLLPTILSLAFPHEVPSAGRAIGALPAAVILAGAALALIRRQVAQMLHSRFPREFRLALRVDGTPRFDWHWHGGKMRHYLWIAVLIAVFAVEAWSLYPLYFRDYVAQLPARNYSTTRSMAQAIDDFADDGLAYIKIMPYWYDGNAVRAQLRRTDQNWHNELEALEPDRPPIVGAPGKFMVIVHPQEAASLQALQTAFPKGIALAHSDNDGQTAFITFYGERQ